MVKLLVDTAVAESASAIAHGCTGKGNDQVRLDVGVPYLGRGFKASYLSIQWDQMF